MPISKDRQYRSLQLLNPAQSQKRIDSKYYVEGYATTYEKYLLWNNADEPVYERFERNAFIGCDMSDVIMQYDHTGKVFARQSNRTLILEADQNGLFICADLSMSRAAQEMYEEIGNGLVTKMSWTFAPGEYYYDKEARTIVHTKIKKIYDVSAVSIPANDTTDIQARSFIDGEINKVMQELQERDQLKQKISLKLKLGGIE